MHQYQERDVEESVWLKEEEAMNRTKWNIIMISNSIPATPDVGKSPSRRKWKLVSSVPGK